MIDIARWFFFILIFFIAFACSLFFIFSVFAVILQQENALMQPSTSTSNSPFTMTNSTNGNCPTYFYELLKESIPTMIGDDNRKDTTNIADLDFCQQTSNYDTLKKIGPYPAIYYFGQSFQSTLLTTFFTLFGVVADNNIPVGILLTGKLV